MGRVSQLTPPVKSISQVGLLIMLVSIFFLVFFASCIHVEARPNVGSMNVDMNDVDMNIGGGSGNGFDGNDFERSLLQACKARGYDRRESAQPETSQAEMSQAEQFSLWGISDIMQFGPLPGGSLGYSPAQLARMSQSLWAAQMSDRIKRFRADIE